MKYFAIIGAQRSGTTSLYHALDAHPCVNMIKPVQPEPRLFMMSYDERQRQDIQILDTRMDGWVGEKSVAYMENPYVAQMIKKKFDDAKVMVVLRNPVDRALSHYHYSVSNNLETRTVTDAIIHQKDTPTHFQTAMDPYAYLGRGCYHDYLKPWKAVFGEDMLVLKFEDLVKGQGLGDVFEFLGIHQPGEPVTFGHHNQLDYKVDNEVTEYLKAFYKKHNQLLKEEWGVQW